MKVAEKTSKKAIKRGIPNIFRKKIETPPEHKYKSLYESMKKVMGMPKIDLSNVFKRKPGRPIGSKKAVKVTEQKLKEVLEFPRDSSRYS